MHSTFSLGPRIRRCRPSIHLSHALPFLGCGPVLGILGIGIGLLTGDGGALGVGVLLALVLTPITLLVCTIHWSAYLDLHTNGLVVGRVFPSSSRAMWYSEIHPATIRVFSRIDDLRSGLNAQIPLRWHITGGANHAVTFLGPLRHGPLSTRARPPAPGRGMVIFGSRQAAEIAAQIRAGLERGGCPPHLARWSEKFSIEAVRGPGFFGEKQIPGMRRDWKP